MFVGECNRVMEKFHFQSPSLTLGDPGVEDSEAVPVTVEKAPTLYRLGLNRKERLERGIFLIG